MESITLNIIYNTNTKKLTVNIRNMLMGNLIDKMLSLFNLMIYNIEKITLKRGDEEDMIGINDLKFDVFLKDLINNKTINENDHFFV